MNANKPLQLGILGAGRIATHALAPAIAEVDTVELAAVASRDRARAEALGPKRAYDTYAALLDDPQVDAVYIATHNGLHAEQTIAALQRGKHVLCEKPLGRTADECRAMVDAARRHDQVLLEAFMYRYDPRIATAKQLVDDGAIGPLRRVEASFSFHLANADDVRWRRDWGGGGLFDVGCYCVNACRYFFGGLPQAVQAGGTFHPDHDVDLALHGLLEFGAGRWGAISTSFDAGVRCEVNLIGERGVITLPHAFLRRRREPAVLELHVGDHTERREFPAINVYALELADFASAILTGSAPRLPADEGWHNALVLDALLAAARSQTRQTVNGG